MATSTKAIENPNRHVSFFTGTLLAILLVLGVDPILARDAPGSFAIEHIEAREYGDFAGIEYVEHEFAIEGQAVLEDGSEFSYRTRAWIWTPADPGEANGSALFEPLHSLGVGPGTERFGGSLPGTLVLGEELLFERGFVLATVQWSPPLLGPEAGEVWLEVRPEEVSGHEQADIGLHVLADLAEALRDGHEDIAVHTGELDRVYSVGPSQTGGVQRRLLLDPLPDRRTPLFDGWLILVMGANTFPTDLDQDFREPGPREESGLVMTLNSETDVYLDSYNAAEVRDGPENFRSYEAVGAHIPLADYAAGWDMSLEEACRAMYMDYCEGLAPVGWGFAARALFVALDRWVVEGEAPPDSRHLQFDPDDPYNPAHFDETGNRLGGIRAPEIEVGAVRSHPLETDGDLFFRMLGEERTGELFPAAVRFITGRAVELDLTDRYDSHDDYMAAINEVVEALMEDGFLLERDAERVRARAEKEREQWAR